MDLPSGDSCHQTALRTNRPETDEVRIARGPGAPARRFCAGMSFALSEIINSAAGRLSRQRISSDQDWHLANAAEDLSSVRWRPVGRSLWLLTLSGAEVFVQERRTN